MNYFTIVHRKGYKNWNDKKYFPHDWCIEFGFVEMKPGINHYLWIYVEEDKLDHFIERYKLEKK